MSFPAISCGAYGYPVPDAARIALTTVAENARGLETVHFVLYSEDILATFTAVADEVLA